MGITALGNPFANVGETFSLAPFDATLRVQPLLEETLVELEKDKYRKGTADPHAAGVAGLGLDRSAELTAKPCSATSAMTRR